MDGPELLGDPPRVRQLVELLVVEADRERPHRLAGLLGHRRHDGRRVDPAREEGAERHVGDHAPPGRLAERRADALAPLLDGHARQLRGVVELQ